MLSNNLKHYIQGVDKKDPKSKSRRLLYGLFIDIAQTLPLMRKSKGLSQRDLAKLLKTSHPTIARWETPGYTGYTLSKLIEVAEALDFTVDMRFIPKGVAINRVESVKWSDDLINVYAQVNQEIFSREFKVGVIAKEIRS